MAEFVIDASATLPWCLKDEETAWTISLLRRFGWGDRAIVPAHWLAEVSNALLSAQRRKRIPLGRAPLFLDELGELPVDSEPHLSTLRAQRVFSLAERHQLTFYDAAYLEIAQRLQLPLATLDAALIRAAERDGILRA